MSITVIGIFKVFNSAEFESYKSQVGAIIALYGGTIVRRGECHTPFWNQLHAAKFDAFVELSFATKEDAQSWANSPEYAAILPVRERAMTLTLFSVGN